MQAETVSRILYCPKAVLIIYLSDQPGTYPSKRSEADDFIVPYAILLRTGFTLPP